MDFTYDSDDLAASRAAYSELKEAKERGFFYGNITFLAYIAKTVYANPNGQVSYLRRMTKSNWLCGFIAAGSMYNLFIYSVTVYVLFPPDQD